MDAFMPVMNNLDLDVEIDIYSTKEWTKQIFSTHQKRNKHRMNTNMVRF